MHKNVYVRPHHSEGERKRQIDEAARIAEIVDNPNVLYETLVNHLKPQVVQIVERAFRRYAKAHNAPQEQIELEWKRFKKILNGML